MIEEIDDTHKDLIAKMEAVQRKIKRLEGEKEYIQNKGIALRTGTAIPETREIPQVEQDIEATEKELEQLWKLYLETPYKGTLLVTKVITYDDMGDYPVKQYQTSFYKGGRAWRLTWSDKGVPLIASTVDVDPNGCPVKVEYRIKITKVKREEPKKPEPLPQPATKTDEGMAMVQGGRTVEELVTKRRICKKCGAENLVKFDLCQNCTASLVGIPLTDAKENNTKSTKQTKKKRLGIF